MNNDQFNRRSFCRGLLAAVVLPCLGLSACSSLEPEEFLAGEEITPPIGCVELLERSENGDC